MTAAREPQRAADAYAEVIAEIVAKAPPLTPAQVQRIGALLRPQPHAEAPGPSSPVASAGPASHGLSAGARPHPAPEQPHAPSQRATRALRRPAFRATPEATS